MFCGCILGLSGVYRSLNSCEGLVACGHPVDSSPNTPPSTPRIHPNTPSYANEYTEDTCPDRPWIYTGHALPIYHSYDILGHLRVSSEILRHTTYGVWNIDMPYIIGHVGLSVGVSGCIWGVADTS